MGDGKKRGSPCLEVQMSQMQNQTQAMQTSSSICQPTVTRCTNSTDGVLRPAQVMCFPGPLANCYPLYQFHTWSPMPCTGHVFSRSFGQLLPTVPVPYMESCILYTSCVFQVLWPAVTLCTNSIHGVLYPVHIMCFPGPLASYLITKTSHRKIALLGSVMVVLGMLLMPFLPYIPALCISFGVLSGNHHLSNVNQSSHVTCCSVGGSVCLSVSKCHALPLFFCFCFLRGTQVKMAGGLNCRKYGPIPSAGFILLVLSIFA